MNLSYLDLCKLDSICSHKFPILLLNSSVSSIDDAKTIIYQSDLMKYADSFRIIMNRDLHAQSKEHFYMMPLKDAMRCIYRCGASDYITVDEFLRKSIIPISYSDMVLKMQQVDISAMRKAKEEMVMENLKRYDMSVLKEIYFLCRDDLYNCSLLLEYSRPIVLRLKTKSADEYGSCTTRVYDYTYSINKVLYDLNTVEISEAKVDICIYTGSAKDVMNINKDEGNLLTLLHTHNLDVENLEGSLRLVTEFYRPLDKIAGLKNSVEADRFMRRS